MPSASTPTNRQVTESDNPPRSRNTSSDVNYRSRTGGAKAAAPESRSPTESLSEARGRKFTRTRKAHPAQGPHQPGAARRPRPRRARLQQPQKLAGPHPPAQEPRPGHHHAARPAVLTRQHTTRWQAITTCARPLSPARTPPSPPAPAR